jgi:L-malate glycosyltransferase
VRVLYFSDNTSGHNQRFLEKLSQSGLEVWFLDPCTNRLEESWLPKGVRWARTKQIVPLNSPPAQFARFLPEFRGVLAEIKPDVVHAGPIQTCGYVTALSNFHPWLLCSWGSDLLLYAQQSPELLQATQAALSAADSFFCDCDTVRAKAKEFTDFPDSRVVQLPWGIKKGSFEPSGSLPTKEHFEREAGTHVIICTRAWEPLYGIGTLLEAFFQAYRVDSRLRLLLLGNGSEAERVREFIAVHGLEHVIHTHGPFGKEVMPMWFRAADTYVSCTQSDGTSVSLLEAMATGLPVVVTDIPSNREWVTENVNGWLAEPNLAEEFANRLLCAARLTDERRRSFSERNRHIVEQRADWDQNFPRLVEMYERITTMSVIREP